MADEPGPPPAGPGRSGAASGEPQTGAEVERDRLPSGEQDTRAAAESYGIVSVTRHVKEDGRSLLLYARRAPEGP